MSYHAPAPTTNSTAITIPVIEPGPRPEGAFTGKANGCPVGAPEGSLLGLLVGCEEGSLLGQLDGCPVGADDGTADGLNVGRTVGIAVGLGVGGLLSCERKQKKINYFHITQKYKTRGCFEFLLA